MKREKRWMMVIICLLALLTNSVYSLAQDKGVKKGPPGEAKVLTDATLKILGSKYISGKIVKGAPYSATAITESIQTLSDGNQIVRKNEATLYRDSEGRTRIDQRLETIGKWNTAGDPPQMILIYDPVADLHYSLNSRTKLAYKGTSPKAAAIAYELDLKRKLIEEQKAKMAKPDSEPSSDEKALKKKVDPNRKTESLGTQMIEGVQVEGTRSILTIPEGEIGNTRPIEIVDESWYSPELQVMVMSKHHDPRSGDTVYRLTNINRSEPDRSLFEVPADYPIVDESESEKNFKLDMEIKKKMLEQKKKPEQEDQ